MTLRKTYAIETATAKPCFSQAAGYRYAHDQSLALRCSGLRGQRRSDPPTDVFEARMMPVAKACLGISLASVFRKPVWRHQNPNLCVRWTLEQCACAGQAEHDPKQEAVFH